MTGEGGTSLVLEKTSKGAALLVEKGEGAPVEVSVTKVLAQDNVKSDPDAGTGAVEIRQNRKVVVRECVFKRNNNSVRLNGQGTAIDTLFTNVALERNDFAEALPTGDTTGAALCGSNFGARTQLTLGAGNEFPSTTVSGPGTCTSLSMGQELGCNGGSDIGYEVFSNDFALTCL